MRPDVAVETDVARASKMASAARSFSIPASARCSPGMRDVRHVCRVFSQRWGRALVPVNLADLRRLADYALRVRGQRWP